jgi:alkanesulfonate monooxygenase SsuD/methylene tetrahydromethanopterin reductase-like flavin-dependent oxidoreductase (luciferase family)
VAEVKIDVLVDPFGARWSDVRSMARAAEDSGFDGLWTWDHLAGSVHGADRVLEAWTVLSALAAVTDRLMLGPMVLNVANRDPGTLAVMAATLQEVCGDRLLLGLGAGGGVGTPYASEQRALGREVPSDVIRRRQVADAIATLRRVWSGRSGEASGFLVPAVVPPVIVGGFGPQMAGLAGRLADGINAPAGPGLGALVKVARRAHADAGRDPSRFIVTASAGFDDRWVALGSAARRQVEDLGVDRLVLVTKASAWKRIATQRPNS